MSNFCTKMNWGWGKKGGRNYSALYSIITKYHSCFHGNNIHSNNSNHDNGTWKCRMMVHTSPRVSLGLPSTISSDRMFTRRIWKMGLNEVKTTRPFIKVGHRQESASNNFCILCRVPYHYSSPTTGYTVVDLFL